MNRFIDDLTFASRQSVKKIDNFIYPLKQLGVTYFATQTVTVNGQWSIISSNPAWIEYSAGNQLYQYDPTLINPSHYASGICFVDSHDHDDFRNIFCKHSEGKWDLGNGLALIDKHKTHCEFTFIATMVKNKKIINVYLNNLALIKKFVNYFKIENNTIIRGAKEYSIDIKSINKSYDSIDNKFAYPSSISDEKNEINNILFHRLSPREYECIKLFLQGKTAKETAYRLNLSYRTIEDYFVNIKKKLKCKYKRDLLTLFSKEIKMDFCNENHTENTKLE